jgi:glutathione S-transferase
MKLYYTPGACSMAPHIVANEAGVPVELVKVDLRAKTTEQGSNYLGVNSRGYVPALDIGESEPLTEASVIVQYLADKAPEKGLLPAAGTVARLRVQQWLTFIATELHKGFSPLFNPTFPEEARKIVIDRLKLRLADLEQKLAGKHYLTGDTYTVADAYAFVVLNWAKPLKFDLSDYPNIQAFLGRIAPRPAVQAALKAEGLV